MLFYLLFLHLQNNHWLPVTGNSTQKMYVHMHIVVGKAHNAYLLNVRIFFIYFNFPFLFSLFLCVMFFFYSLLPNGMGLYFIQYELKQFIIALDSFDHSAHRIGSNSTLTQTLQDLERKFEICVIGHYTVIS